MEFTAQQIADLLHGNVEGDAEIKVHDMSKIEEGEPGTITFLANDKYEEYIYDTKASIALVNASFQPQKKLPESLTLIRVPNAYESLAQLLAYYDEFNSHKSGIEEPCYIASTAKLGSNVYVGAFSYIGDGVEIEDNVKIYPNSYIGDHVKVGKNL